MEPEIYFGGYYSVETDNGTWIVPVDVAGTWRRGEDDWESQLQPYCEGTIDPDQCEPKAQSGWLGRLSMPGYMDCTDWQVFESEVEAQQELEETFGIVD